MASIREHIVRNWPLKIAAVALSAILWVAVAAEETRSQLVEVRLDVDVPPSLALGGPAPALRALVTGPARELAKLAGTPLTVRVVVPPETPPPRIRLTVVPADVELPRSVNLTVQDIEPRAFDLDVDRFVRRQVPVALRGTVEAESGFAVTGPLVITPRTVEVSGPRAAVYALDSVHTELLDIRGLTAAFERTAPLDTILPLLSVVPRRVTVTGRVGPL